MDDVRTLPGVGDATYSLLKKIGISSVSDVVENVPRKYDDYSKVTPIAQLSPGPVTIKGTLQTIKARYAKKGLHITEALVVDDTGRVRISWFNQPYRAQSLKEGHEYYVSGEFAKNYRFLTIQNPACELASDFPLHTARLVPQYKLTKGLKSSQLRKITRAALQNIHYIETLPVWLREEYGLMARIDALRQMHFPETIENLNQAKRRIGFEEVFEMALASELNRQDFAKQKSQHVPFNQEVVVRFVKKLPFKLTDDQRKAAWEILQDMTHGRPMNRLLEGDVGSGKTAVAAISAINVMTQGYQVAFMAPTEILARQHFLSLQKLMPKQFHDKIAFISGSTPNKDRIEMLDRLQNGKTLFIIGTHALIQDRIIFKNLVLVIIDEQHRFGVDQRKELQAKSTQMPHVLHMTATPIPRSVALTLYGELDISLLKQKPGSRQAIETRIIMPEQRQQIYTQVVEELRAGRQLFVVCPQIENSEKNTTRPLSVEQIATQIESWLKPYRVAQLHGKMLAREKEAIMDSFASNDYQVLVSTTVIEVGVDVPNASVMIIEGADSFGLAQLHQLRGRIGRGAFAGKCYLVPTTNESPSQRLRFIETENDGFKLAEYDLELRGPGALYGTVQHGALDLRVAKLSDVSLIKEARQAAREFVKRGENLVQYTQLKRRIDRLRTITNLN